MVDMFPKLPYAPSDFDMLARAVAAVPPAKGLRGALMDPLDQRQAALPDEAQQVLKALRGQFPPSNPFSYMPLSVFLWQWAGYAGLVAPHLTAREGINAAIAEAGTDYAKSPLFRVLLVSAEGQMGRFWGTFGQWGSLFMNHGRIATQVGKQQATLTFTDHCTEAAQFFIPGLLRGWMKHFRVEGELQLVVEDALRFDVKIQWDEAERQSA